MEIEKKRKKVAKKRKKLYRIGNRKIGKEALEL